MSAKSFDIANTYTVGGVAINYPFRPYPGQMCMMDRIIKALDRKQGCLIESPTGSGKSLALLCAALAWQSREAELLKTNSNVAQQSTLVQSEPDCGGLNGTNSSFNVAQESLIAMEPQIRKVPKIYVGTRTHKQIAQLIRELRRTQYSDVKITILSSRKHTCINPAVRQEPNISEACKDMLLSKNGPKCSYHAKLKASYNHPQKIREKLAKHGDFVAFDIEDLTRTGRKCGFCPYFASTRVLTEDAQLIFCPYNYLIDPMIRKMMEIDLTGEIVILDEAHNLEDSCRDAVSFDVPYEEVQAAEMNFSELVKDGTETELNGLLRGLCYSLRNWLDMKMKEKDLLKSHPRDRDGFKVYKVWSGEEAATIFQHEIGYDDSDLEELWKTVKELGFDEEEQKEGKQTAKPLSASLNLVEKILYFLTYIYKKNRMYQRDYKMCLMREVTYNNNRHKSARPANVWMGRGILTQETADQRDTVLHFWCLNPAVAFNDIGDCVRSVVLASGTLSPMTSFQSELGYDFSLQLAAPHILSKERVWAGTLGKGPKDFNLRAVYGVTQTADFQDEIGAVLMELCRSIPSGILCFFASYSILQMMLRRWTTTGLLRRLEQFKLVVQEPKSAEELKEVMVNYYGAIDEPASVSPNCTGALFLAVCRGKVSEGLDFADDYGRAVITVGIPYPSVMDLQVELKRAYNDQHRVEKKLLSGAEWYEIQAFRALNQALGRCLRHKNDWAAIILIDSRFCEDQFGRAVVSGNVPQSNGKYIGGLSKWVQKYLSQYSSYSGMLSSLTPFLERLIAEKSEQNAEVTSEPDPDISVINERRYGDFDDEDSNGGKGRKRSFNIDFAGMAGFGNKPSSKRKSSAPKFTSGLIDFVPNSEKSIKDDLSDFSSDTLESWELQSSDGKKSTGRKPRQAKRQRRTRKSMPALGGQGLANIGIESAPTVGSNSESTLFDCWKHKPSRVAGIRCSLMIQSHSAIELGIDDSFSSVASPQLVYEDTTGRGIDSPASPDLFSTRGSSSAQSTNNSYMTSTPFLVNNVVECLPPLSVPCPSVAFSPPMDPPYLEECDSDDTIVLSNISTPSKLAQKEPVEFGAMSVYGRNGVEASHSSDFQNGAIKLFCGVPALNDSLCCDTIPLRRTGDIRSNLNSRCCLNEESKFVEAIDEADTCNNFSGSDSSHNPPLSSNASSGTQLIVENPAPAVSEKVILNIGGVSIGNVELGSKYDPTCSELGEIVQPCSSGTGISLEDSVVKSCEPVSVSQDQCSPLQDVSNSHSLLTSIRSRVDKTSGLDRKSIDTILNPPKTKRLFAGSVDINTGQIGKSHTVGIAAGEKNMNNVVDLEPVTNCDIESACCSHCDNQLILSTRDKSDTVFAVKIESLCSSFKDLVSADQSGTCLVVRAESFVNCRSVTAKFGEHHISVDWNDTLQVGVQYLACADCMAKRKQAILRGRLSAVVGIRVVCSHNPAYIPLCGWVIICKKNLKTKLCACPLVTDLSRLPTLPDLPVELKNLC